MLSLYYPNLREFFPTFFFLLGKSPIFSFRGYVEINPHNLNIGLASGGEGLKEVKEMETLRIWRHKKELTQKQLADESGVGARQISFIENQRYVPTYVEKERLAEALDAEVDDIGWCKIVCAIAEGKAEGKEE